MGGTSRWWLHHSLTSLNQSLENTLVILRGLASVVLKDLVTETGAHGVFWNRCYEPWRILRDEAIEKELGALDRRCEIFNGGLLWEPGQVAAHDSGYGDNRFGQVESFIWSMFAATSLTLGLMHEALWLRSSHTAMVIVGVRTLDPVAGATPAGCPSAKAFSCHECLVGRMIITDAHIHKFCANVDIRAFG
jgi:hypothetical protein